jgi:hypothetical protein
MTTITDLDDFKALDPFLCIIEEGSLGDTAARSWNNRWGLAIARLQPVDELLRDDIVSRARRGRRSERHVRVVLLNGGHHVLERRRPPSRQRSAAHIPSTRRADYAGRGSASGRTWP